MTVIGFVSVRVRSTLATFVRRRAVLITTAGHDSRLKFTFQMIGFKDRSD